MNPPDDIRDDAPILVNYDQFKDDEPSAALDDAILSYARASTKKQGRWIWPVSMAAGLLLTVGFFAKMGSLPMENHRSSEVYGDADALSSAQSPAPMTTTDLEEARQRPESLALGQSNAPDGRPSIQSAEINNSAHAAKKESRSNRRLASEESMTLAPQNDAMAPAEPLLEVARESDDLAKVAPMVAPKVSSKDAFRDEIQAPMLNGVTVDEAVSHLNGLDSQASWATAQHLVQGLDPTQAPLALIEVVLNQSVRFKDHQTFSKWYPQLIQRFPEHSSRQEWTQWMQGQAKEQAQPSSQTDG